MRHRNGGKGEALPMAAFADQYSLPNIFFDIGQL
jgi:hypothetical protein